MAAGIASAVVGVLGVLLPVIPGTPFLVLSAVCWVRSSKKLYVALLENRFAGPLLYRWRKTGTLEPRFRLVIVLTVVVSVAISAIFIAPSGWPQVFVVTLGAVGVVVILRIPTVPRGGQGRPDGVGGRRSARSQRRARARSGAAFRPGG